MRTVSFNVYKYGELTEMGRYTAREQLAHKVEMVRLNELQHIMQNFINLLFPSGKYNRFDFTTGEHKDAGLKFAFRFTTEHLQALYDMVHDESWDAKNEFVTNEGNMSQRAMLELRSRLEWTELLEDSKKVKSIFDDIEYRYSIMHNRTVSNFGWRVTDLDNPYSRVIKQLDLLSRVIRASLEGFADEVLYTDITHEEFLQFCIDEQLDLEFTVDGIPYTIVTD